MLGRMVLRDSTGWRPSRSSPGWKHATPQDAAIHRGNQSLREHRV